MSLGTTGLKQSAGMIDEEFLARLRGPNGVRTYLEMWLNSPIIGAALHVIETLITQTEWRVEPAKGNKSPEAKAEAEDTENSLGDMSHTWEEMISEILSMLVFGWSYFETVYKIRRGQTKDPRTRSQYDDGKWGWRKIEIRGQETLDRWQFDDEGGLDGMHQMDTYQGTRAFIPIVKALLFRTKFFKGNPEGISMLRPAVVSYWFAKRIPQFEAIGIERELAGMPIFEVPPEILSPNASANDRALRTLLEQFVTEIRRDERYGGLVPSSVNEDGTKSQYEFRLVNSGGRRQIDTDVVVKRHESRMLMVFLAQFLILGQDKVGTQSLGTTFTDLFGVALGALMDKIASVFNRFAIRRRQELNGKPIELDPYLVHGDVSKPDLDKIGKYLTALAAAGIDLSEDAIQRKLLEIGTLPIPDEHETPDIPDKPEKPPEPGEPAPEGEEAPEEEEAAAD
jgi:hypothetical protein